MIKKTQISNSFRLINLCRLTNMQEEKGLGLKSKGLSGSTNFTIVLSMDFNQVNWLLQVSVSTSHNSDIVTRPDMMVVYSDHNRVLANIYPTLVMPQALC